MTSVRFVCTAWSENMPYYEPKWSVEPLRFETFARSGLMLTAPADGYFFRSVKNVTAGIRDVGRLCDRPE
jgi:hypothetical protein